MHIGKTHLEVSAITRLVVTGAMSDARATRGKVFGDSVVPAAHVHATIMSALEFGYGKVTTTADFVS